MSKNKRTVHKLLVEVDMSIKQDTVVRSDISKIQSRLFDILTIRVTNTDTTTTHMYYDHQRIQDYSKGLKYNKLYKIIFRVESIQEYKELERNIILHPFNPDARVILPDKGHCVQIRSPFTKIIVKANFYNEEKRNMFYQKTTKIFRILDT